MERQNLKSNQILTYKGCFRYRRHVDIKERREFDQDTLSHPRELNVKLTAFRVLTS